VRFVADPRPLPGTWARKPGVKKLVAEADITLHPHARLAAKLLVFDKPASLRQFWKTISPCDIGAECNGVVNSLGRECLDVDSGIKRLRGDRRYFCVIGLCESHLQMEIIAHESVHAGFCYERRVKRNLFGQAADFDEERIAYPAGIIAGAINRFLHSKGLYPA
jgi:hypothetical protein